MTRWQRHRRDLGWIPCANNQAAAVWIRSDLRDDVINLIDPFAVWAAPIRPLRSINAPEVALRIRPFIPDRDARFVERTNVRVAAQKPKQLVDDRLQVQLLRCQERKILPQIKA